MSSDLETNVVAVERIKEYSETPTEVGLLLLSLTFEEIRLFKAPWESDANWKPPKEWPSEGEIRFEEYATRYRPGLDLVLSGLNAEIAAAEKVGIVGRTGAGHC